jgi:hypothetical protein
MTTQHDAIHAVKEADRLYVEWQDAEGRAGREKTPAAIEAALTAYVVYDRARDRARLLASVFGVDSVMEVAR